MKLHKLLDKEELDQAISEGYVNVRAHPEDPSLRVLNYSKLTEREWHWTPITRTCRGLIVRDDEIVARPWPKFFTWGQAEAEADVRPEENVIVTDKVDGALGIAYQAPDGLWSIATRGSFTSEWALHATRVLRERYPRWKPLSGNWLTYMFEIVYPEGRIVLDYGDMDDLVFLGATSTATGRQKYTPLTETSWRGPRAEYLREAKTFVDALNIAPRERAEGVVIHFQESDTRVKVKQDDYLELQRFAKGLSRHEIFRRMRDNGGSYVSILDTAPDEFRDYVIGIGEEILARRHAIEQGLWNLHLEILAQMPTGRFDRKKYAEIARTTGHPHWGHVFMILDDWDEANVSKSIWKTMGNEKAWQENTEGEG